jgi:eukaryotic translation initiation factor 2C
LKEIILTDITQTKARLLPSPEVHFGGSKFNPGTSGRWDLRGKKFFRPNIKLESWGVCALQGTVDKATLDNFFKVFIQTYVSHDLLLLEKSS